MTESPFGVDVKLLSFSLGKKIEDLEDCLVGLWEKTSSNLLAGMERI